MKKITTQFEAPVTPDQITQLQIAVRDADRAWRACPRLPYSRRFALRRELDSACAALNAAQARARDAWARARGWEYAAHAWHTRYPELDHYEGFVLADPRRDHRRRPPLVAWISHSYASRDELERYAAANNLNAEFLAWSSWNPQGCIAVVFTPKGGVS